MHVTGAVIVGGLVIVGLQFAAIVDRVSDRRAEPKTARRATRRKSTTKTTRRRKPTKLPRGAFLARVGHDEYEELDDATQVYLKALYEQKQPHNLGFEVWYAPSDKSKDWLEFPHIEHSPTPPTLPQYAPPPAYYPPRIPAPTPGYPVDYRPRPPVRGW
jgi:hypothetical protein